MQAQADPDTFGVAVHRLCTRLDAEMLERLQKLGFRNYRAHYAFDACPYLTKALRERPVAADLDQALGQLDEPLVPLSATGESIYVERLPCMEPIRTVPLGLRSLLKNYYQEIMCLRLQAEGKGLRKAVLKCHRIDGRKVQVGITTTKGSHSVSHLMRLFQLQISKIEPALGIELFVLEASRVEDMETVQEQIWAVDKGLADTALAELLDRVAGKSWRGCHPALFTSRTLLAGTLC